MHDAKPPNSMASSPPPLDKARSASSKDILSSPQISPLRATAKMVDSANTHDVSGPWDRGEMPLAFPVLDAAEDEEQLDLSETYRLLLLAEDERDDDRRRQQQEQDLAFAFQLHAEEMAELSHSARQAHVVDENSPSEEGAPPMSTTNESSPNGCLSWEENQQQALLQNIGLATRLHAEDGTHLDPAILKDAVRSSLKPCQYQAIRYVERDAKILHKAELPKLFDRVKSLGFTAKDLDRCLDYICNDAPIVIHLHPHTLNQLTHDTHYRNVFETGTTNGNRSLRDRKSWEMQMFGGHYNGSEPFDRPKYGCLNLTGDIRGVQVARAYGTVVLVLASSVRYRSTFYSGDSSVFGHCMRQKALATCDAYAHILNEYADHDLETALRMSVSQLQELSLRSIYKEVQIHGPVNLATDIQALSVPGHCHTADPGLKRDVLEFQNATCCNVFWQQDLLDPSG